MDNLQNQIESAMTAQAARVWAKMAKIYPQLLALKPPAIEYSKRMTSTAGLCVIEDRIVRLGIKFILHSNEYAGIMRDEILPHEIMHQIDYDLNGFPDKNRWHHWKWQKLMMEYGLPPATCHNMDIRS